MNGKRAFTLVELLVVIAIITLLMGIMMPAMSRIQEYAKRVVCLNNLKSLMTAWNMYADNNAEMIVGGSPGGDSGWIGRGGGNNNNNNLTARQRARNTISSGALWDYLHNMDVYKCPTGLINEYVTYAIVDSMNGNDHAAINEEGRNKTGIFIRNRLDIKSPARRIVFLDEGFSTPDSFTVYYHEELWWDTAPVRHGDGATFSFADGHAGYKKWMGENTLIYGHERAMGSDLGSNEPARDKKPQSQAEFDDLHWLQLGTWSEFGYSDPTFNG